MKRTSISWGVIRLAADAGILMLTAAALHSAAPAVPAFGYVACALVRVSVRIVRQP